MEKIAQKHNDQNEDKKIEAYADPVASKPKDRNGTKHVNTEEEQKIALKSEEKAFEIAKTTKEEN